MIVANPTVAKPIYACVIEAIPIVDIPTNSFSMLASEIVDIATLSWLIEAIPIVAIPVKDWLIVANPVTLKSPKISTSYWGDKILTPNLPLLVMTIFRWFPLEIKWKSSCGLTVPIPTEPTPEMTTTWVDAVPTTWNLWTGYSILIPTEPTPVTTTGLEVAELTWNLWTGSVVPIPTLSENIPVPLTSNLCNGFVVPTPTLLSAIRFVSALIVPSTSNWYCAVVLPIDTFSLATSA